MRTPFIDCVYCKDKLDSDELEMELSCCMDCMQTHGMSCPECGRNQWREGKKVRRGARMEVTMECRHCRFKMVTGE